MLESNLFNAIIIAYMGASLGSFVVCWTWRAQRGISIVTVAHSFCDNCEKKLNFFEVMPIFGVFFNRGRCSRCQYVYPKTSFKVEVLFAMLLPSFYFGSESILISLVFTVFISLMVSALIEAFN